MLQLRHFGYNNVEQYDPDAVDDPARLIGGSTFEDPDKIVYIDELDDKDNVNVRLEETKEYRDSNLIKPEMEWMADGTVMINMFLPVNKRVAVIAAVEFAKKMNLEEAEVINAEVMQEAEGTRIELKGRLPFDVNLDELVIPPEPHVLSDDEIRRNQNYPMKVVCVQ